MLQLEVGKYYRNRAGEKIGPLESQDHHTYIYKITNEGTYTKTGHYWNNNNPCKDDLIEEWKDEETKSMRDGEVEENPEMFEHWTFEENSAAPIETIKIDDTASILAERQKTHGDFTDNARVMQKLKEAVMCEDGWQKLSLVQREALQMILHKCGRIISGNPNEPDHWLDIAGYATLAKDRVER